MRWGQCVVAGSLFWPFVAGAGFAQSANTTPATSLVQELSNNTSACSSANDPGGNQPYCFAFFTGFGTNPNDTGAETLTPDSTAGHVSNLSIKQLMHPGWTGRVLCEYQPWFGASNHKSVGYNQNSAATVAAQDSFMLAVGCDINLIDFYGALDPNQSFNLATTNAVFSDLSTRAGYPLKFGIMEDKNALTTTCSPSSQNESASVVCLENALVAEMDYVNTHYASSGAYFTDSGNPVVFSFVTQSTWPVLTSADWDAIWSTLKAHTDAYAAPFKYILEFGSFTSAAYDNGRYAWMQPSRYSSTQQFWWGSGTSLSPTYLDNFYVAGLAHPSQITVGGLWKGFDDNNASWSGNRVIAQQCGQVLLQTASEIAKYFGGSNPEIPYVQVATWNDYEEGTAVEPGIDNCYTVNASLSGSQLTWSLAASDPYASPTTVNHFTVYYADAGGSMYTAPSNIPATTTTLNLSSIIPSGTWTVYVEMVGQPLIINRVSNGVTFNHGASVASLSPVSLSFVGQTVGSTSLTQTVTLNNTGSTLVTIYGITVTGDFAETNNCPVSLVPASSCTAAVTFSPTASGSRAGALQVSDSAGSVQQVAALAGTGLVPAISFSPGVLTFSPQTLGGTSSAQTVTLTNTGAGVLNVSGIIVNGDFSVGSNTCSGSITPSSSCSFNVTFAPRAAGAQVGSVILTSNAPATASLSLTGSGADFGISGTPNLQSVAAGGAATYMVSVPSVGATFSHAINLTCTGLPANATCSFSPGSLNADSLSTLTITTKAAQIAGVELPGRPRRVSLAAIWLQTSGIGLVGLAFATRRKRFTSRTGILFFIATLILLGFALGCGGSTSNRSMIPGTATGSYNISVAGSAGALTHSASLTLTVK
jgi:hypothetical protein